MGKVVLMIQKIESWRWYCNWSTLPWSRLFHTAC